jgi:hypothetical protein
MSSPRSSISSWTEIGVLMAGVFAFQTNAVASDNNSPVVVELFQSQGCSSCPPANANLNALSSRPDILALSFSVTYWDSLGGKTHSPRMSSPLGNMPMRALSPAKSIPRKSWSTAASKGSAPIAPNWMRLSARRRVSPVGLRSLSPMVGSALDPPRRHPHRQTSGSFGLIRKRLRFRSCEGKTRARLCRIKTSCMNSSDSGRGAAGASISRCRPPAIPLGPPPSWCNPAATGGFYPRRKSDELSAGALR